MNRAERRNLMAAARKMVGRKVTEISFPGGKSRKSVRLHFDGGGTAIATRRRTSERRNHEVSVMRALAEHGGPVPRVLGVSGDLMLQEDLGETRLSQHLHDLREDPGQVAQVLDLAVGALAQIHEAALAAGLGDGAKVLGADPAWIEGLVRCPSEIEERLGLDVPDLPVDALVHLLRVRTPRFVKWDSRPGNALVRGDRAFWFDWEHSGARNSVDDLIWLICDEFVTFLPEIETALLGRHLDRFTGDFGTRDEAEDYFAAMAVFHTIVRLSLIVSNKGRGSWWSMTRCLEGDKVGVTLRCARRLVWRGKAWAERSEKVRPMADWFQMLEEHFEAA